MAQSMAAARATVDADRSIHSLHAYFLRPGDASQSVEYQVSHTRDGRSFSHRQVVARQDGKDLFQMICSWNIAADSPYFAGSLMPDVPPPDEVSYSYNDFVQDQMYDVDYLNTVSVRPMAIKYINPPQTRTETDQVEPQLMWIRIQDTLTDERWLHDAGLAYISDSTLIDHITLPHGKRWMDSDFDGTSLDHAMWFHDWTDVTDWVLFEQEVNWTGTGRGLATGRLFSQKGKLLATCVQEGLMRM